MTKEKKNQHYVPEFYLKFWATNKKDQIYVYDKKNKNVFLTNVNNIATERYFYDIDLSGILSDEDLKSYGIHKDDVEHLDDGQFFENFFANEIEGDFKNRISNIVNRVANMNQWEIKNCFFVSMPDKVYLSYHLALQVLRVKATRSMIESESDCIEQILRDMGASEQTIDKYTVKNNHLSYLQGKMIADKKVIKELIISICNLTWVLLVNKTNLSFFTSDNPIGTQAHIHHPILSMRGFRSSGVEAFFPLSPNYLLFMCDGEYHDHIKHKERTIEEIDMQEIITYYNSLQLYESERYVFSNTNDFSLAQKLLQKNSQAFDFPRVEMNFGGKTYISR